MFDQSVKVEIKANRCFAAGIIFIWVRKHERRTPHIMNTSDAMLLPRLMFDQALPESHSALFSFYPSSIYRP